MDTIMITITSSPADIMRWERVGPRYSAEYYSAQDRCARLETEQAAWEADYGRRWAENVRQIAADRGYDDVTVVISDDDTALRTMTSTEASAEDWAEDAAGEVMSVERIIALLAHDMTLAVDG